MTKTKSQLRAEAVERLELIGLHNARYRSFVDVLVPNVMGRTALEIRDALIDLLTDDERESIQIAKKDKFEFDTREKLEEDVRHFVNYWAYDDYVSDEAVEEMRVECMSELTELLDRQDAITTQKCTDVYESGCEACRRAQKREVLELHEKVDSLEAENAKLKEELRLVNTYSGVKGCECETTVFGMKLDEVRGLKAENVALREKLSQALDHAHAIGKLGEL